MKARIPVKNTDGVSSGSVTCRKRAQVPAPSTAAASWYSCGIAWRPARKMITVVPSPCQTLITTIEGIAQNGSLIHFWGGIPNVLRKSLSSPPCGL